jgi:hypothetical protein
MTNAAPTAIPSAAAPEAAAPQAAFGSDAITVYRAR